MKILVALWLMMMEQLCARYAIKDWLLLILENVTSKRFILLEGQLLAKFAKQWWRKDHFISMPNKFTEWVRKLWKISSNLTNSWNKIVYYNTILRKNFLFLIDFHCACAEKLCCNFTIFLFNFIFVADIDGGLAVQNDGSVFCTVCCKTFKNLKSAKGHFAEVHQPDSQGTRVCTICKAVVKKRSIYMHYKIHGVTYTSMKNLIKPS